MTITDKCIEIRLWLNEGEDEYPDTLVTTWVRGAEERFNRELRVDDMVEIETASINIDRVVMPSRWLEGDFVRLVDGSPLAFKDRTSFYTRGESDEYENLGKYTITGRYIIVGNADATTPPDVEMSYYASVPPLDDTDTWLSTKYPTLLLFGALEQANIYGIEDERAGAMGERVGMMIEKLNDMHKVSKVSGSRLNYKSKRSFG